VTSKLFRLPLSLRLVTWLVIAVWTLVALFPLLWMLVMSFKLPIDGFHPNPFVVMFGPRTLEVVGGLSVFSIVLTAAAIYGLLTVFAARGAWLERLGSTAEGTKPWVFISFYIGFLLLAAFSLFFLVPWLSQLFTFLLGSIPVINTLVKPILGLTTQHYNAVWIDNAFYQYFFNTLFVTLGVVSISLTLGTLAGYGLARTRTAWVFWILIAVLILRALPASTIVTGYLSPFIEWGLYGKRIAVIIVLVALNQPFTVWMLRSFFMNIPAALDEAALVDGCNRLQAFWYVIMPIMWPGVITTGLFSFLLAYNDYLVSALLLDGQTRTMVPAIMSFFNRETTTTDQLEAIAAAASITFPLFLLVLFFQKQIVSGLTQGAVKG
jgi:trehalose/maltose transport system permease protein